MPDIISSRLNTDTANEKKRCLVLGGKGFIGSHLVDALLSAGYRVRIFDRDESTAIQLAIPHPDLETIAGDFSDQNAISKAIADCDICFHLISTTLPQTSNQDPIFDIESNLVNTVKLLQHAKDAGVKKIIFLSSGGTVYGVPQHLPITENHPTNPICSYGITKLAIEKYLHLFHQLHGLDYTILRLSNPFGERQRIHASQGAVAVFLGKALNQEKIEIWGDGSVMRDYIYIADVIDAIFAVLQYRGMEHIFNIGSGIGTSLKKIIEEISQVTHTPLQVTYTHKRQFDVPENMLSIDKARQELNWFPKTSFNQGLKQMAEWVKQNIV